METSILFRVQGLGDLVSRVIMGIIMVPRWVIGAMSPLTKSP